MMRLPFVFYILNLAVVSVFILGCSNRAGSTAKLKIQFDESVMGTDKNHQSKLSSLSDDSLDWGLVDPTSLSQINCYGVFVYGEESKMQDSSCSMKNDKIIKFGPRAGFYPLSQGAELEVPPGENRTIYLVGMSSVDGLCHSDFAKDPDIEAVNYSNPFIIGETTADLLLKENVVEIVLKDSFSDTNKIKNCDFFEEDNADNDGTIPQLTLSEVDTFSFPNTAVGGHSTQLFTLTNNSSKEVGNLHEIALSAPFSFTGGAFPGSGGDCTETLSSLSTCRLEIQFSPTGTQSSTGSLEVAYAYQDQTASVARLLEGTGESPAALTISESDPYDFGVEAITGGWETNNFTVTNTGSANAISVMVTGLSAPFFIHSTTCTSTLAGGSSCDLIIKFQPTTLGLHSDDIDISYHDGVTAQVSSRSVQGTGANPALLTITEAPSYNFGAIDVFTDITATFTVSNTGGVDADILSYSFTTGIDFNFSGGGAAPGLGGSCMASLSAGSTCTVELIYSPSSMGSHNDVFSISYYDGVNPSPLVLNLNGMGTSP